jgi:ATP-dependent RNA helicase SUPV3L1/SUV3
VEGATETTNSRATDGITLAEDGARLEGNSAKEKETQGSIETATQTGNAAEIVPETTPETVPERSLAVAAVVAIENADASAASEVVLAKTDNRTIENADTDPVVTETAAVAVTEVVAESVVETGTETATESAAETEAEAAPDMEVFFTFTWGRNRAQSKPKGQGRRFSDGPAKEAASNTGDTAKNDGRGGSNSRKSRHNKPDGEQAAQDRAGLKKSGQSRQTTPGQQKTGRDKFNRDNDRKPSKGKSRNNERPKQFAASPKKSQQIDPDNPFAAALMGLKDKI